MNDPFSTRFGGSTKDHPPHLFRRRLLGAAALAITVGVLLAACQSSSPRVSEHSSEATSIPATPVGGQLRWVLDQLNGAATELTEEDVRAHFAPGFLETLPAPAIVQTLKQNSAQAGGVTFSGFAGQPTSTGAIALIVPEKGSLGRAAIYIDVAPPAPHQITSFQISDVPGPSAEDIATPGPYTGAFDVGGGREFFLSCTGSGSPTVVFESGAGGGAAAWTKILPEIASLTLVCSYDRANIPGGASDPAAKPRTAQDVVDDLAALLAAARVPGPYVLVGHSDGGLFVRLYASEHPDQVAGMVLVDAVSEDQDALEEALLKKLLTPEQWEQYQQGQEQAANAPFVEQIGDEQIDLGASFEQMRAARSAHPLRPMPLFVLTHGVASTPAPDEPPGFSEARERVWQQLQDGLARLVPNAKHAVVKDSGHIIQVEQPEAVIEAIRQVVEAVRDPGTWEG